MAAPCALLLSFCSYGSHVLHLTEIGNRATRKGSRSPLPANRAAAQKVNAWELSRKSFERGVAHMKAHSLL